MIEYTSESDSQGNVIPLERVCIMAWNGKYQKQTRLRRLEPDFTLHTPKHSHILTYDGDKIYGVWYAFWWCIEILGYCEFLLI